MPVRRPKNLPDGRTVLSATLGLARGAPPVSEKDSSGGALALSPEDGFARGLPQNDTNRRHAVFPRIRSGPYHSAEVDFCRAWSVLEPARLTGR